MSIENKNIMPNFDLFPRITRVCKALNRLVLGPHLFSEVSDHKFDHPFDHELYDNPQQRLFDADLSGAGYYVDEP